ncbi:MAG: thymidine phosphorylase family protein [Gammaproteobacteria bacterium]|nr:thymidine phosphorylase family protein [Gammaproteobacteria bacterium]MBU1654960.1 thymidine phosphorylase family protein [Gammaproteobacteria bacterium]MBU1960074.1 thymidine phosphorylase family protein [Gammaproteobacteria bacterium]
MNGELCAVNNLKLRHVAIDTYRENVAYLHRDCPLYRSEGFQALSKIEIHKAGDGPPVIAVLNVVGDPAIIALGELGLSEQVFAQMGLPEGSAVRICHAALPGSLAAVHRKIGGDRLTQSDYREIAKDIVENRYSRIELSAFLVSCAETGMEREEVLYLTRAMVETGSHLDWGEPLVVDKHCIGGIPGNRTTPLVVSIVAAHGMLFPKTSSRAITSPAGTADTMEVLARVDLAPEEMQKVVRCERGCLTWGGTARLAPMDDILISVERPLSLDSPGQMVASILSKKIAAGATRLLIDIPLGPTAKVRSRAEAMRLRKLFEYVGDAMGLFLEVVITDGSQPIGRGIGPVLEVRDLMQVLRRDPKAPLDLREKALQLAGRILEFDPDVRGGSGYAIARDILDSGRALAKLEAIIQAQGANTEMALPGRLHHPVEAAKAGWVTVIDNLQLARIARLAGAPMDKGAGVDLHRKLGDRVRKGEPLYSIHAEFPADFEFAIQAARQNPGYEISR